MWPFKKEQPEPARKRKAPYIRSYSAAKIDRLTQDWKGTSQSKNEELRTAIPTVRKRARDLAINNDYARRYLGMVKANVVGANGITLQSKVETPRGKQDNRANTRVEKAFKQWGKNPTVGGNLSWIDVQNIVSETAARDGEALVISILDRRSRSMKLQLIDIDRLDVEFNDANRNIRMSIEYNDMRQPIAYWILTKHPSDASGYIKKEYERIPAERVKHLYRAEQPEQERGISWMASSMTRLNMLGAYEEAELVATRIAASKMGFFTSPDGDGYTGDDTENADGTGNVISEAEPGVFEQLPEGVSFTPFDPQHPAGNFAPFMKTVLRGIASGLGVSYNGLASDLEGVNFSSIRTGVLEERDQWRGLQRWLSDSFHQWVFEKWLEAALLFGQIDGYGPQDYDYLNHAMWQPRGWAWVDPQKDINASVEAINNKLKTRADVVAESGKDLEDVLKQLQQEEELLAKYNLTTGDSNGQDDQNQPAA